MIETLLRKGEYAPVDKIVTYSGYRAKDVEMILSKLNKMKFLIILLKMILNRLSKTACFCGNNLAKMIK